ncbi:carbohydrate-binding module family 21 [Fusarium austroafricanum]|uniref:Carbohydrate-binding module family 21 n=1 Tax=Fusarium austroafricanum TaxID=2364996 RepID=A0A8H4NP62_9HYPO|nr:carbohydrate-binding module family 21 [Fusarium austroafricanum]
MSNELLHGAKLGVQRRQASDRGLEFPWEALSADLQAAIPSKNDFLQLPSNLPELVDSIVNRLPLRLPEPSIPENHGRVHWTCRCGQQLFDDFITSTPAQLQELQEELQHLEQSSDGDGGSACETSARANLFQWNSPNSLELHNRLKQLLNRSDQDSNTLPLQHLEPQRPQPTNGTSQHLLMCIDRGRHFTELQQHVLMNVSNDFQLMHFMREKSGRPARFRHWFTFKSVEAVSLTRLTTSSLR